MQINRLDLTQQQLYTQRRDNNSVRPSFAKHQDTFESDFTKKKKQVAANLKNCRLVDKKLLQELVQSKNQTQFNLALENIMESVFQNYQNGFSPFDNTLWQKAQKQRKTNLETEQYFHKKMDKDNKELLQILKNLCEKDTDPQVTNIKNTLLQKYGIKNAYLDNNPRKAKMYLEAVKILKSKNFPLPDNIIVSRHLPAGGVSFNIDGETYIIVNPEDKDNAWMQSTQSPMHQFVHEIVHCSQPALLAFNIKRIPQNFKDTVENLSAYADENFTHEIHAELVTKFLLDELNSEEKALKKYIEN